MLVGHYQFIGVTVFNGAYSIYLLFAVLIQDFYGANSLCKDRHIPLAILLFNKVAFDIEILRLFFNVIQNFAIVNMADIPDSDCLACEDIATGMGIIALKYAFNKNKLLELLPQFCKFLNKMPQHEASCLLKKTSIYFKKPLRFGNGKASFSAALSL